MVSKRKRSLAFESLESRKLLSANSMTLSGGVLKIRGTNHADTIDVARATSGPNAGMVQVTLNGKQKFFNYDYTGSSTGSITGVIINGRGGNDQISIADNVYFPALIDGGRGNDTISSGVGNDVINGGRGNDSILGNLGDDTIVGGKGNDHLDGGEGSDKAAGGKGNDYLLGGAGNDDLAGDAGNDELHGDDDKDTCFGGKGDDLIFGGAHDDLLDGGIGNDECVGEEGNDTIFGQLGDDRLYGQEGNDVISGGAGRDICDGGMNKDALFGDAGDDMLAGGDENDHLDGGDGVDTVLGGAGDDQLKGGVGIDTLDGETGNNLLDNEAESDVMLNGLVTDLDREFRMEFGSGPLPTFAQFDLQNVNGEVVEKLTVEAHNLVGQTHFDLLVDGLPAVQVPVDSNGDGFLEYSTNPTGAELPFPLSFPPLGSGTSVGASSQPAGHIVQKYVI
jgi:Ca2+-binding RTX toxin-like protein